MQSEYFHNEILRWIQALCRLNLLRNGLLLWRSILSDDRLANTKLSQSSGCQLFGLYNPLCDGYMHHICHATQKSNRNCASGQGNFIPKQTELSFATKGNRLASTDDHWQCNWHQLLRCLHHHQLHQFEKFDSLLSESYSDSQFVSRILHCY